MATKPHSQKRLRDANFINTKALPAAAATNYSDAMDLGQVDGGGEPLGFEISVEVPALPNNTDDTKTVLATLQDSADGVTFADVEPLHQVQVPGVASTGSAAKEFRLRPPSTLRRYIRFDQTVPTGGGDNTAEEITYALNF